ncbi:MAG: glycosyltransferase family A protein [Candidatus Binatus sp.]|uniref:glycosyltransferase family 2 protein n=1 Tax=Candidatus Binatus sp. TaxID=2811406 RepID=UPI003BAE9F84
MAKVSVIIPVYNGAATIGRALASVFAQTFTDYEVMVINDGSTDDTAAVLSRYGDRIRVITQPNRGLSAARNAGVRASHGEYLAFLDDDDQWMPEKLARCVPVLDADPGCALAYTLAVKVDAQGELMGSQSQTEGQPDGVESPTMQEMLTRPWNVVPSQFVVRRDVFERCGGFHERFVTSCEDLYFLLTAREYGGFRCVPEPLLRKETRPLYPKALEREPECDLFVELVRDRYGASADGLIDGFRRSRVKVLRHLGHILIDEGRPEDARRCLARVLHYEPASPKAYYRYLKTFILPRGARASASTDRPGV